MNTQGNQYKQSFITFCASISVVDVIDGMMVLISPSEALTKCCPSLIFMCIIDIHLRIYTHIHAYI